MQCSTGAAFRDFMEMPNVYKPEQIDDVLSIVRPNFRFSWSNKKLKHFNVPMALDIETTSFYEDGEKRGTMYEWTLGIYGLVIIGRTYDEMVSCINRLSEILDLGEQKRIIIYVHNLAYEFQWIRHHFTWDKVFAIDSRKPVYAITDNGIEFRCSYLLSGYSLENLGRNLRTYQVKKLVGSLDYTKPRHSKTHLTYDELWYCVNDVRVVMAYIMERIEQEGGISKIPLTKTGYVRKYCRDSCFYEPGKPRKKSLKRKKYRDLIKNLTIEPDEYLQLKRGFQGGFTHANPFYSGRTIQDVTSYDFTSSYPAVMLSERFPMSKGEHITIGSMDQLEETLQLYCCLFDVEFIGLETRLHYESYISRSRCFFFEGGIVNNGRVVSADRLRTTVTEQDFMIIREFYTWDNMRVSNFRRYRKGYLPTDFVKAILKLYQDKTQLKGVAGEEVNYQRSKEQLNSCYGMAVTDIIRTEYGYNEDWIEPVMPDLVEHLDKYNKGAGRFLFYPWGCWVTAYARRNLFTGILEFGNDYIYSDTDSIKVLHAGRHAAYLEDYNQRITRQLERAMDYHGLPLDSIRPKTKDGIEKPLGVWDLDGTYKRFKTLGAKRYLVEYSDGGYGLTVAGLNKKQALPYMTDRFGDPFKGFTDQLYIPKEYTGKLTHTYIDEPQDGVLVDYLGSLGEYHEKSIIHLGPADYSLSISQEYKDFLLQIRQEEWRS